MRAPSIKLRTYLMTVDLFQDLGDASLERIEAGTRRVDVERGDMLFRRGDPCDGFHTVVYGQVKLSMVGASGTEKVLDVVRAGQSFGRASMFAGLPYPTDAQALADTMLLHVSAQAIEEEIARTPTLAQRLLSGLGGQVLGLLSSVESISLRSGVQRLVGYLLRNMSAVDGRAGRVQLDIRKCHLASLLNLTPEHLSRMLGELARDAILRVDGARIDILDRERLARIAET